MRRIFLIVTLAATLCGCARDGSLPRADYDADVEAAVDAFIEATRTMPQDPDFIELHSVMLVKHGEVLAERWLNGASPDSAHVMHSVSKTFTAVALGLAVDDGLLSVDDRVIDFFPDKLPAEVSDNLSQMTVRDLLTMTCGQHREPASVRTSGVDWVEGFLAAPVEHEPGTFFAYNSLGTYMVSAIIQKLTGQKVVDLLYDRVYKPLHINRLYWEESPQGINCGGWGLYARTEDMAKLGQLLLNGGEWNGERILSEEWVSEMTSIQVDNWRATDPRPDWTSGYCYFMWHCANDSVRADGSNGQYIIIFPERDAEIVLTTDTQLYQPYLDLVWEYLAPIL